MPGVPGARRRARGRARGDQSGPDRPAPQPAHGLPAACPRSVARGG